MAKTNYSPPRWTSCPQCQSPIEQLPGRGRARKYCSKSCKDEARKQAEAQRERPKCAIDGCERSARSPVDGALCEMHYYRIRRNGEAGPPEMIQGGHAECAYCGEETTGSMFCSSRCAGRYYRGHPPTRECPVCGTEYDPISDYGRDRLVCSDECDRARQHRSSALRRLRVSSNVGLISPKEVFSRDGHSCQSCGIDVKDNCGPGYHPERAEVDHIIPLAKGGTHTWANLQTLCSRCNRRKGAKLPKNHNNMQGRLEL